MSLENAPDEVKLAVDLIMLLEQHEMAPELVLKALEIVKRDFEKKLESVRPSPVTGEGRGNYAGVLASDHPLSDRVSLQSAHHLLHYAGALQAD